MRCDCRRVAAGQLRGLGAPVVKDRNQAPVNIELAGIAFPVTFYCDGTPARWFLASNHGAWSLTQPQQLSRAMLWGSPLLSRRQALSNRPAQAISAAWICTSLSVRESTVQSAGVVTTEYPVRSLTNAPYSQAQRSALHGRTAQGQTSHMPLDLCDDEFPTAATACRAMAYQEGERREEVWRTRLRADPSRQRRDDSAVSP